MQYDDDEKKGVSHKSGMILCVFIFNS